MKRADIKAGVVYGYDESQGHHYQYAPVVVLSTDLYMRDRYSHVLGPADKRHTAMASGRASYSNAVGMLAVFPSFTSKHAQYDELLARLLELARVDRAVESLNEGGWNVTDGVDAQTGKPVVLGRYGLLTNQRYLHGDYAALQAELDEAERKRTEYASQAEEKRRAAVAERNRLADRLDGLGLTGYHVQSYESPTSRISLKADDLERLLDLAECCASDPEHGI